MIADKNSYLKEITQELFSGWPKKKPVNIVCHGHSIPCGYTANSVVKMRDAYPSLLHELMCERYPLSVSNVIVSGIGGEASVNGKDRFEEDALSHKPRVVTIDYGRNDMYMTIPNVEACWGNMIEKALEEGVKVILVTPAPDCGQIYYNEDHRRSSDEELTEAVKALANKYQVGLVDAAGAFQKKVEAGESLNKYIISVNHLTRRGHQVIADELIEWFPYYMVV